MSIFSINIQSKTIKRVGIPVSLVIGLITITMFFGCKKQPKILVDMIMYNGTVYTVDDSFNIHTAIVISGDSIVASGDDKSILATYEAAQTIDLQGKTVYPGFIDAHCHFFGYGQDLQELDLKNTISFEDMIQKTIKYAQDNNPTIVVGRGWNEENWESKSTPNKFKLDALFPETPVVLYRIDGHAVLCNQAALNLVNIDEKTQVVGGSVVKMGVLLTGLLVDKAADLIRDKLPEISYNQKINALLAAQDACLKAGLTTVSDAGLDLDIINLVDSLHKANALKIRVYAMANPNEKELEIIFKEGLRNTERLILRSVKLYCDGAMGSRGALMKTGYCDDPLNYGLLQSSKAYYERLVQWCFDNNFQVNTHCIGDSANALMLKIYADVLKEKNDRRWRIEHAQVVSEDDWHWFKDFSIIPSVQPTHATSDMYMALERLCTEERLKGAYAYNSLMQQNQLIAFGTDFPVEAIDPLGTYFSAVYRMGNKGEAFRLNEAISPQNAITAMTRWAAYANFMDDFTGSIQKGKKADLVILDADLIRCSNRNEVNPKLTMVNGEILFNNGIQLVSQTK